MNDAEIGQYLEAKLQRRELFWSRAHNLASSGKNSAVTILSTDDTSRIEVSRFAALGVSVTQFPATLEAAYAAKQLSLRTTVGANNLLLSKSQSGNINADELLQNGLIDIICSDYNPSSLLPAVFRVARHGSSLPAAVKMATLIPARVMGLNDRGSLTNGQRGDIILVTITNGYPFVYRIFLGGRPLLSLPRDLASSE
jgi:alpha-D-ribose 1-methylphosphonate 5-triphosphate diphosphatase